MKRKKWTPYCRLPRRRQTYPFEAYAHVVSPLFPQEILR